MSGHGWRTAPGASVVSYKCFYSELGTFELDLAPNSRKTTDITQQKYMSELSTLSRQNGISTLKTAQIVGKHLSPLVDISIIKQNDFAPLNESSSRGVDS